MKITVTDAYPTAPMGYPSRPICQAKLTEYVCEQNRRWAKEGRLNKHSNRYRRKVPPDQCANFARYKIESGWYCRKHGALVALDLVAERIEPKRGEDRG